MPSQKSSDPVVRQSIDTIRSIKDLAIRRSKMIRWFNTSLQTVRVAGSALALCLTWRKQKKEE